jgi:hypothetical protein
LLPQRSNLALDRIVLGEKAFEVANLTDVTSERRLRVGELSLESSDGGGVRRVVSRREGGGTRTTRDAGVRR